MPDRGRPVPPSLIRRADAAGITAYRSYGSSEHPTVTTGTIADSLDNRAATDGGLLAGNEVRLVDADGRDVPAGHDGEILTRGPELFTGYTDPALNAAAFLPGRWFRTGDVGRLDADGYLTVTDRLKDIIIRGGENISSKEVEDLLVTHPAVADVAVIASPDPVMGERVCAVIVTRPGFTFDVDRPGSISPRPEPPGRRRPSSSCSWTSCRGPPRARSARTCCGGQEGGSERQRSVSSRRSICQ